MDDFGPKAKEDEKAKKKLNIFRALGVFTNLGFSMMACILIGVFAGKYIDGFLGTSPIFLLIFSLLGGAASIKLLYDTAIKLLK